MKAQGFPISPAKAETWLSFCDRMATFVKGDLGKDVTGLAEWYGKIDRYSVGPFPDESPGADWQFWRDSEVLVYVRQGTESHIVEMAFLNRGRYSLLPFWHFKTFDCAAIAFVLARLTAWVGGNGLELPEWKGVAE